LEYQYQVMSKRGAEEEDVIADLQWQIAYWKDAYKTKPGPGVDPQRIPKRRRTSTLAFAGRY